MCAVGGVPPPCRTAVGVPSRLSPLNLSVTDPFLQSSRMVRRLSYLLV